ncbi:MAG: hypothetical protein KKA81_13310 [Bacteroidetes bacterium]|nr:hypothetical protein [Bacteroidota bacterium]
MKTKFKLQLLAACVLGSIIIFQVGCKKDEEEETEDKPVILKETTKIIDETIWQDTYISMDSSTYTYTFNTSFNDMEIEVGDVMASNAGNGCLRKIKSINSAKDGVEVETEQASLEDAIESGRVILNTPLDVEDIESVKFNYPGISVMRSDLKQTDALEFTISFNVILKDVDGDTTNTDDQVKITGSCTFLWNLVTVIDYSVLGGLEYVDCGFISNQRLQLDFTGSIGFSGEVDLGEVIFKKKEIKVAGLTVPLKPTFQLFLGGELTGNISLNASVIDDMGFNAGVKYTGSWKPYSTFNNTLNFSPPEIGLSMEAEGYLKPQMTLLIYGVKGPYAYCKGYAKGIGQLPQVPWWGLYAGFTIGAGAEVEIFGKKIFDIDLEVYNKEWTLKKGPQPTVSTNDVTNIQRSTASCGGKVTDDGGYTVTDRGVCWSTSQEPTINDAFSSSGSGGTGSFSCQLTGLLSNTNYIVRAYATNEKGTDYGEQDIFKTKSYPPAIPCPGTPTVTYAGKKYNTVQINNQCWMKENLDVGEMIEVANEQANNGKIEKWCIWDLKENCDTFGGLYQWKELMNYQNQQGAQGICPPGWHIPTDAEWTELTNFLGGENTAGGLMKQTGTQFWSAPNAGADNQSGFAAIAGGIGGWGDFWDMKWKAYFWSSTEKDPNTAWYRMLNSENTTVSRINYDEQKILGRSVRCLKN